MNTKYLIPHNWPPNYEVIICDDWNPSKCISCCIPQSCLAQKEFLETHGSKFCWSCFQKLFAQKCYNCQRAINGLSQMSFIYFDQEAWHKECFKCPKCGNSLAGQGYIQEDTCIHCKRCKNHIKCQSSLWKYTF